MIRKEPTIAIINGANWIGKNLAEIMLKQGGNVILVDDFTGQKAQIVKKFSENKKFIFIEKNKIDTLKTEFKNIKYIIHLKHDFNTSDDKISSKAFLEETKFVDEVLSIAVDKKSIYILISSIHLHKDFILKRNHPRGKTTDAYNESDLQDYIERTVLEYFHKAGLNGRVVRLGNVYGPQMNLDCDPILKEIFLDAFNNEEIKVDGDGLQFLYYVYITDAIQGIIKALFIDKTKGKIYSITNPEEISILTIANKIVSLNTRAKRIKFVRGNNAYDALFEKSYLPDENLTEIGWRPKVSFERGITQVINYFREDPALIKEPDPSSLDVSSFDALQSNASSEDINIIFGIDDTVNLSNLVLNQKKDNTSTIQSKDPFYDKLNTTNSPIYNSNNKKNESIRSKIFGPQSLKRKVLKYSSVVITISAIYIFLIVPILRIGILGWKIKSNSDLLTSYITKSDTPIQINALGLEANDDLSSVNWALTLVHQEKMQNNIVSLASGIDDTGKAIQYINDNNLNKYLNSKGKVSESDTPKIKNLIMILDQSQTNLSTALQLPIPGDLKVEITSIKDWTQKLHDNYTSLLSA